VIAAPAKYLDALRYSHEARLRVTLYDAGGLVGTLPVVSVRLKIDGTAAIRRTGTIEVAIDPWGTASRDVIEQINVQAGEVKIEHGIAWPNEPTDWVTIARMRIADGSKALLAATRNIELYDRALLIQEYNFPTVWPMDKVKPSPPGVPELYIDLIERAVAQTLPDVTIVVDPTIDITEKPLPYQSFGRGDDRLDAIITMAEALDAEFFNNNEGDFVLADANTVVTTPVWTVSAGEEGVLVSMEETFNRQEQYNAVGLTASAEDEQDKYAFVWDDDPASPTFFDGPFGKRPIFLSETYAHMPTIAKVESTAIRRLQAYLGATRSLRLNTLYNPLLQPGDRITVEWPDGTSEVQIIDVIDLTLGDGASMGIETRLDRL